ncbi:hypothetical protein [Mixta calida]|uniref:hypothetical protein n=1 Tax=Mixta calida TaxID=665913 RepID=UPI00119FA048|nr:hypothetical protein [Mixta calida]DAV72769.1 MAG TPA: hypothetical protein [Caudoviricetes sp.]
MAAICLDSSSVSDFGLESIEVFESFPKIENQIGDIPYEPEESRLFLISSHVALPDNCIGLKALTIALLVIFAVIVGLVGERTMYYIPLYAALTPVVYWTLKIGYAYCVVKAQDLHVNSKSFSGKDHG